MHTKTTCNFPKFYICKQGAFYEGEIVAQYCWAGGQSYYYVNDVVIDKFFIHYLDYVPVLYVRFKALNLKKTWSLPCDNYLGKFYRKIPKKYCK